MRCRFWIRNPPEIVSSIHSPFRPKDDPAYSSAPDHIERPGSRDLGGAPPPCTPSSLASLTGASTSSLHSPRGELATLRLYFDAGSDRAPLIWPRSNSEVSTDPGEEIAPCGPITRQIATSSTSKVSQTLSLRSLSALLENRFRSASPELGGRQVLDDQAHASISS